MVKNNIRNRRKGVVVVRNRRGVLVVAGKRGSYILPGGGAERGERRKSAAIRELREETGLRVKKIKKLGEYTGRMFKSHSGRRIRNKGKLYEVEAKGKPKPMNEIKRIGYWKPGSRLRISKGTEKLLRKFVFSEVSD